MNELATTTDCSCSCCICHKKGAVHLWYENDTKTKRPYLGIVCDLCMFFRDNDTLDEYKDAARNIVVDKNLIIRQKCLSQTKKGLSKRALRDRKRGCKDFMTTGELERFLKENPQCFYCGGCSSNIDRDSVKDCYKDCYKDCRGVPSCYKCNRRRRDKPRQVFLEHMKRVASASGKAS